MSKPTRTARCAVWVKAALLLTATLAAPAVLAQAITSSLSGRVVTPAGKGVAEAVIEAVSIDDGALRTALTDPQGRYRLDLLRPGRWNVVASTPDGNRSEARQVELGLQQTVRLDFVVLTGLSETITVQATPPLVDPQRSWGEVRVGAQQTDHLPVAGRTVTDLALLDSSVVGTIEGNFFGERSSVFVLNGQSGRANAFLVDGLDNGDRTSSTTLNSFFSQQVIDEFVVLTQQYAPEYGRAAGGVLNIITRRGNNDVSGELFVQGTTSSWNSVGDLVAGLPGATSESAVSRDAMGLAIGGPLKKDRAFYFVSFERQRADDAIPYTGIDRDGIAGGVLQAPFESDNVFLRTDFHLSPSNLLMLRISADKRKSKGLNVGGVYTPETGSALEERDWQLASSLQTLIRPDLTNEVRVLVGGSSFEQQANSIRPGVNRPSGIFGGNPLNAQDRDEERFQLVENLTWTRGAHRLKFGIDVLHTKTDALTTFHPQGNFLYETDRAIEFGDIDCSRVTRNVLREKADENKEVAEIPELGIDCRGEPGIDDDGDGQTDEPLRLWTYPVAYSLIDGRPDVIFSDTLFALFAQDAWQLNERLLLNYGFRYDVSTFELGRSAAVASIIPNGGARRDTNDIAPRFGFTYTPFGSSRLLLRGGAGIFYDKIPLAFPAASAVTSGIRIGLAFPQGEAIGLTEDLVEQVGIDTVRSALRFPEELQLRFSTGTELDTPYVVQYTLGAEWRLGKAGAVRFDANKSLGYHQVLLRDLNPVAEVFTPDDPGVPLSSFDPNEVPFGVPIHRDPEVGSIAAIVTEGRSWYSGYSVGWRWRSSESWVSASYTWSKSEDLGPDPLKGGISLPPNSDDLSGEKARSDTDRRHRAVIAGEIPLPAGFRASAIVQYASGAPFNVTLGRDTNLDGQDNDRPAGVGRNSGEGTPLELVNALRSDAELTPIDGLDEPDFLQVDFRLIRPFLAGNDRFGGELFVQVFNVFNRLNPALVEGRVLAWNFGEPVGLAGPPRTVEAGLKVQF